MHEIIYYYISRWGTVAKKCYDGLQPLESNIYQVEFNPRRRELVSTCEKIKVLHKIIINLHQNYCLKIRDKSSRRRRVWYELHMGQMEDD